MTNKRLISKCFNWIYFHECCQHQQLIAWWRWGGLTLSLTVSFCKRHVWQEYRRHWKWKRILYMKKWSCGPLFTSMCWARFSLFAGQMHLFPSLPYFSLCKPDSASILCGINVSICPSTAVFSLLLWFLLCPTELYVARGFVVTMCCDFPI